MYVLEILSSLGVKDGRTVSGGVVTFKVSVNGASLPSVASFSRHTMRVLHLFKKLTLNSFMSILFMHAVDNYNGRS